MNLSTFSISLIFSLWGPVVIFVLIFNSVYKAGGFSLSNLSLSNWETWILCSRIVAGVSGHTCLNLLNLICFYLTTFALSILTKFFWDFELRNWRLLPFLTVTTKLFELRAFISLWVAGWGAYDYFLTTVSLLIMGWSRAFDFFWTGFGEFTGDNTKFAPDKGDWATEYDGEKSIVIFKGLNAFDLSDRKFIGIFPSFLCCSFITVIGIWIWAGCKCGR